MARLNLHLARMARSATAFGIPFDAEGACRLVAGLKGPAPLRCRMTLAADGALDLATSPMPPAAASWRFAIADGRLEADDPMLQHKTTRRALYDQVRRDLPAGVQEMVFLNTRGSFAKERSPISPSPPRKAKGSRHRWPPVVCRGSVVRACWRSARCARRF